MPKLLGVDANVAMQTIHGFDYTSIAVDKLGATEYTIAGIALDITGSVEPFKTGLEDMLTVSLGSLKKSPRALNLLARTIAFNSGGIQEFHGFTLLNTIDPAGFKGLIQPGGMTNLYDATLNIIESVNEYTKGLYDSEYICNANAIIYIITDGDDNDSIKADPDKIREAIANIRKAEALESIQIILIGINDADPHFKQRLLDFHASVGIDKYISMGDVTTGKLAKLGGFISQSVSTTSQNLGTGNPSQDVNNFKF